jgi:hypothetical protein
MSDMIQINQELLLDTICTDTWVRRAWPEYLQLCNDPRFTKAKFYYFSQRIRIERKLLPLKLNMGAVGEYRNHNY